MDPTTRNRGRWTSLRLPSSCSFEQLESTGSANSPRLPHVSSVKNHTSLVDRVIECVSRAGSEVKKLFKEFQLRRICEEFVAKVPVGKSIYFELEIWNAKKILNTALAECIDKDEPGGEKLFFDVFVKCLHSCSDEKLSGIIKMMSGNKGCDPSFSRPELKVGWIGLENLATRVVTERFGSSIAGELATFIGFNNPESRLGRNGCCNNARRRVNVDSEFSRYCKFTRLINEMGVVKGGELGDEVIKIIKESLLKFTLSKIEKNDLWTVLYNDLSHIVRPVKYKEIVPNVKGAIKKQKKFTGFKENDKSTLCNEYIYRINGEKIRLFAEIEVDIQTIRSRIEQTHDAEANKKERARLLKLHREWSRKETEENFEKGMLAAETYFVPSQNFHESLLKVGEAIYGQVNILGAAEESFYD